MAFKIWPSPPAMIASVASRAPATEPETGASTRETPFFFNCFSSCRVAVGSEELMSTTTVPGEGDAASTAFRTALPSGSMVISTCAPAAACFADLQFPVPFRSKLRTEKPADSRFAAISLPMRPRPMKASVFTP